MPSRLQVDRRLLTILLIVFVQMAGSAMVLPILPLFAQREFAMGPQVITLLISSFFAAQFFAGPYLGRLSDQRGRLPILVLSQFGTTVSYVLLAFAPSVWVLFVARIVDGITGGNIIVAQAYITDVTPREKRTAALGYIFAVFGIGFIVGPALGGILSAIFGPRIPFLFAAAAAFAAMLLSWFVLDETVTDEKRTAIRQRRSLPLSEVAANTTLVMILAIAFVGQFAMGLLQATFALYGEAVLFAGYSEQATNLGVGLLLASVGVGQIITQVFLLQRLLNRFGDLWLVFAGSIIRAASLFLFAMITRPWLGAVSSLFFAMGMGLLMPALQSLTTQTVDDELRGAVLGFYQSSVSMATIVSTAVGGIIFAISPTTPYWLGGSLSLLALGPALLLARHFSARRAAARHTGATPGPPVR
jgi:multidrug resistance protein